jgi:hypothetical protein
MRRPPAEGFLGCLCTSATGCHCSDCALMGNAVTLLTATADTFTDFMDFQSKKGWVGISSPLTPSVTDFIWVAADFSYDCSLLTPPISLCTPAGTVTNNCYSCFGATAMFSTVCAGHTFSVVFHPTFSCTGTCQLATLIFFMK